MMRSYEKVLNLLALLIFYLFLAAPRSAEPPRCGVVSITPGQSLGMELLTFPGLSNMTEKSMTLSLYTMNGREALRQTNHLTDSKNHSSSLAFNVAGLRQGCYLYRIAASHAQSVFPVSSLNSWQANLLFGNISDESLPPDPSSGGLSVCGDINGDTFPDLVIVTDNTLSQPRLLLNDRHGHFLDSGQGLMPERALAASDLELLDADSDNDLDLLLIASDGSLSSNYGYWLYFNDGDGHFVDASRSNLPEEIGTTSMRVACGLINQDAFPDLVVVGGVWESTLSVLLNDGHGRFSDHSAILLPDTLAYGINDVALADINGDHHIDILLSDFYRALISEDSPDPIAEFSGQDAVLVQHEDNHFVDETSLRMPPEPADKGGLKIFVRDITNDGAPEIFVLRVKIDPWSLLCTLYLNDGRGHFTDATAGRFDQQGMTWINDISFADYDNDGWVDLYLNLLNPDSETGCAFDALFLNKDGILYNATERLPAIPDLSISSCALDFDSDGDMDIFISNGSTITGEKARDALLENLTFETGIQRHSVLPDEIALPQNYPNPFNPETRISFSLQQPAQIDLAIFNLRGERVATLASDYFGSGSHSILWHAHQSAAGIYIVRLHTPSSIAFKKMTLIF